MDSVDFPSKDSFHTIGFSSDGKVIIIYRANGEGRHVRRCRLAASKGRKAAFSEGENNNHNSETIQVLVFTNSSR